MTTPVLQVRDVARRYGKRSVLESVSLDLAPGEHVALVGNNGQGKTTLIRVMLGLLQPNAGEVCLDGRGLSWPRTAEAKRAFGYLPEAVRFYPNLSGRATLRFLGRLKGLRGTELHRQVDAMLERVGLETVAHQRVKTYSKGMRQRLGLAQALLGRPRVLLLDEPTNGLDPDGIHAFYDLLAELQRDGVAVLMASHLLAEIEPRMDRLAVLRDGRIAKLGSIAELAAEAGLPAAIRFVLRAPPAELPVELARLAARAETNGTPNGYLLRVGNGDKFQVLDTLLPHREHVSALAIQDPGLEQVFRHLNQAERGDDVPAEPEEQK